MDTVKSFIGSQCVLIETQFLFGHMFERAPTALSLIRIWSDLSTIMLATLPIIFRTPHLDRRSTLSAPLYCDFTAVNTLTLRF